MRSIREAVIATFAEDAWRRPRGLPCPLSDDAALEYAVHAWLDSRLPLPHAQSLVHHFSGGWPHSYRMSCPAQRRHRLPRHWRLRRPIAEAAGYLPRRPLTYEADLAQTSRYRAVCLAWLTLTYPTGHLPQHLDAAQHLLASCGLRRDAHGALALAPEA